MRGVRGGLDLGEKPLGADDRGQLGPQHFHRHLAVVLQVLRQVDGGHPALAELALEAVAVGKGGGEAVGWGGRHTQRCTAAGIPARRRYQK
mgnify:CR=1 FL=1